MTSIRAQCPDCGDVHLRAADLVVRVCADDESGAYTFQCPECDRPVARNASARIVELLVSSGVEMQVWKRPPELDEPRTGPPISPDELLDFHLGLQQTDWFDELVHAVRRSSSR